MTDQLSDERLREYTSGSMVGETYRMAAEVLALRTLCDEVYQVIGSLAHAAGVFDRPEVERVLNNLIAASVGNPLPHKTLLPFDVCAVGPVMPETPSDAVISAAVNDVVEECIDAYWVRRIYRAIRSALAEEQGK